MRYLLLIPIAYLAAVADTSLAAALRIGQTTPDVLALTAVVWMLLARGRWAFLAAGGVALVGDLAAPGRIGIGSAWMLLAAFAVGQLLPYVRSNHLLVRLAIIIGALTLWTPAVAITARLLGDVVQPWPTLLKHAFGAAAYTSAIALPVLMLAGWLEEPILRRRARLETP